jgi:uncharacterized membrane-anchored protein
MFIALFLVAVTAQLRADRLHPALYWTVIAATSTAGTTLSDFIDRSAGLGYFNGSLILITGLGMIFFVWSRTNETFSVERIQTLRGEDLYWSAILCSNTLGTAFGDWLSDSSGLHFWGAAALIAGVMLLILLAHYVTEISTTLLFWTAFVLTRPLGASVKDLFWKPHAKGGMALGSGKVSLALLAIIAGLIAFSSWQQRREEPAGRAREPSPEPVGG